MSKFASSFSKSQDRNLNFEPDNVVEMKRGVSVETGDGVGDSLKNEVVDEGVILKKMRKTLGLIGASSSEPLTSKRVRCANEGNFVKLNINGYGRKKFAFKNRRTGFNSSSKRLKYSRNSKRSERGTGGEEEIAVSYEEGLGVEIGKRQKRSNPHSELIEEAVMRVRNEVSDENLLKLLKLTHGYESFRDGQLEAIKMVLLGKSTMLVLPTGAGKSLCYQLPALVLPGVTLVVSPLIALMIDQLKQLPPVIQGGLLSSNQVASLLVI